ncbi:MAG: hypothetical protein GY870_14085, partial [archaeon]|nr:hypothetical protein [archaeon]
IRILDKVGSRNYIKKGVFTIPDDIVDHLNFLSGFSSIPKEYKLLLEQIIDGESIGPTAHTKERERLREVEQIVKKNPEELLKNPTVLKKWIRGTKFDSLHPVRLEVLLENLRLDADMRLRKLEENIMFEQHILGGTLGEGFSDDEEGSIIYDGIIKRSNRYPSLFEMVYYGFKPLKTFMTGGTLEEHESDWIWKQFIHKKEEISDIKQMK